MSKNNEVSKKENDLIETLVNDPEILGEVLDNPKVQSLIVQRLHTGPIPSPDDIARYNQHIPDGANRIMAMAEKAQDNGYKVKVKELTMQSKGQLFAFGSVVFFIALGSLHRLFRRY